MAEKCGAGCTPRPCYYKGRQLVASLQGDGFYGTELHFPCGGADCEASKLVKNLPPEPKPLPKPQRLTGDEELDRLEAETREILRKSGLNY